MVDGAGRQPGQQGRLQAVGWAIKDYLISSDFNFKSQFKLVFRGKSISKFQPRPKSNWGSLLKTPVKPNRAGENFPNFPNQVN